MAVLDELTTGLDPQARRDTWELIEDVRARGVTIVLVTHFMEEAERLCDRVALIDAGRVVVVDTPTALAERAQVEQRIQFRPSAPLDDTLLTDLPSVTSVTRRGDVVLVTGTDDALTAVTSSLARHADRGRASARRAAEPGGRVRRAHRPCRYRSKLGARSMSTTTIAGVRPSAGSPSPS